MKKETMSKKQKELFLRQYAPLWYDLLWRKVEETLIHFFGSTWAPSAKNHHSSASFAVRRCWKMGDLKELAAWVKFFRRHKSVPSVQEEQLNPFHHSKKYEVILLWAKNKSVAYSHCLLLHLFRNWIYCSPENN